MRGVGIDMVTISEIERFLPDAAALGDEVALDPLIRRTFTPAERAQAAGRVRPAEYLAGRFAVKEAVFKAVAPLTREGFDLRIVETLADENGAPHVTRTGALAPVLDEAGVRELFVSITNEGDVAAAFVVAQ